MQNIGDLARGLALQLRQNQIKSEMEDLTTEMTTGVKADPARALAGDTTRLSDLQTGLSRIQAYTIANTEAELIADTTQTVLGDIQSATEELGVDFLKIDLATSPEARSALGFSARETFSTMVSRLNTHQAGRSLFAGAATDRAAVMPADDMIADLKTALSGAVTASDVEARLDSWFHDAGGGFDTSGYTGADTHVQPTRLSDTESVTLTVRADDDVFRHLLKHTAMGMLATDPDLGFSDEVQAAVLSNAGQGIVNGQTGLTSLRADVGVVQERISDVQGRNDAQKTVLRVARNAIAAADPYETAIRLEQVQAQLEALYTVTARNRQLSLVNYLR